MRTYDEIPADRRTIGDFTGRLGDGGYCGLLAVSLAQWMARDDSKAEAEAPAGREHRDEHDRRDARRAPPAAVPPGHRDQGGR